MIAVTKQSGVGDDGSGLRQTGICWTARIGTEYVFEASPMFTEMPPNEYGNGKLVASNGCDKIVFKPATKSVVT